MTACKGASNEPVIIYQQGTKDVCFKGALNIALGTGGGGLQKRMYILIKVLRGGPVKIFEVQRGCQQKLFGFGGGAAKYFRIFCHIYPAPPPLWTGEHKWKVHLCGFILASSYRWSFYEGVFCKKFFYIFSLTFVQKSRVSDGLYNIPGSCVGGSLIKLSKGTNHWIVREVEIGVFYKLIIVAQFLVEYIIVNKGEIFFFLTNETNICTKTFAPWSFFNSYWARWFYYICLHTIF